MAQFDVYANTNPATRKNIPYLLDLLDLLDALVTRVVVPLVLAEHMGVGISQLIHILKSRAGQWCCNS